MNNLVRNKQMLNSHAKCPCFQIIYGTNILQPILSSNTEYTFKLEAKIISKLSTLIKNRKTIEHNKSILCKLINFLYNLILLKMLSEGSF